MLSISLIKKLLLALNEELSKTDTKGEIGLCGGAVMCLVFHARKATKDIDGIFQPTQVIHKASEKVAKKFGLSKNWLNDAAKAYFYTDPPRQSVMELSHLRIWAPSADYMLAMKCISARFDSHDQEDVKFLINHLNLKSVSEVFKVICRYYPEQQIPVKTKFFVEEICQADRGLLD